MQTPLEHLDPILRKDIQTVNFYLLQFFFSLNYSTFAMLLVFLIATDLSVIMITPLLQIWDTVSKPQAHKDTPLNEFFRVSCLLYIIEFTCK